MNQLVAGREMAALCGGHPRVKHALALGVVVPIPTCAILASEESIIRMTIVILIFMFLIYSFIFRDSVCFTSHYNNKNSINSLRVQSINS